MEVKEYNKCVDDFSDNVYRFILKNLKDVEKTRDVVQESFARLWVKVEEVNYAKAKSYLFTTAYHVMIDMIRKDKRQEPLDEGHISGHSYEREYSDLNDILHQALDQLPEVQKSVVLLRDYEGYNYKEIGEITQLTNEQVKVYIYRARKFLKQYLGSIESVI